LASTSRQEKLAKLYDADIVPIWSERFGALLLRNLIIPEKGMLLDVGCGTGYPALEILKKAKGSIRIIALDKSSAMLDIARKKAGDKSGKTIFFRTENASQSLSFADEVYDVTYSNLGFMELGNPEINIKELMRVTAPGGQVAITLPLADSWSEFFDIFKDILTKRDKNDIFKDIDSYQRKALPTPEKVVKLMEKAGLLNVKYESQQFELLFKSAREFFFAPVVEYGPLKEWKAIIKISEEMKNLFVDIKDAIDTMFSGLIFPVTINAGCFSGIKPTEEEFEVLDDEDLELIIDEDQE
jgi:ubiquinone/menaquinone biosynthesis C-methylase UbiE